ncbi:MAG: ATP-binding cassette domain-containing protein [Acidimicrobiia bacterium]|nr:ATP-binding cassette domain-containing protein [Acidimicrobiia bacterium]
MPVKLKTQGLCKSFVRGDEELLVLEDINLAINEGEFVAFVGASGCGKTTLLRIIHGLIKPTHGEILVAGEAVQEPSPSRGFVLQEDSLLPWRSVLRNVTFGLEVQGRSTKEADLVAFELLKLVGLNNFENHYPLEISGGMRQRVNLARALAVDPDVLLMDEPFASLDAQTREVMQGELLRIWEQSRKTVLFVTHQIDEAVYLSDRVVVLSTRPGRVKQDVTIDFPRPRDLSIKRSAAFRDRVDVIWRLIEEEVVSTVERGDV